jgi:hypothetical protein
MGTVHRTGFVSLLTGNWILSRICEVRKRAIFTSVICRQADQLMKNNWLWKWVIYKFNFNKNPLVITYLRYIILVDIDQLLKVWTWPSASRTQLQRPTYEHKAISTYAHARSRVFLQRYSSSHFDNLVWEACRPHACMEIHIKNFTPIVLVFHLLYEILPSNLNLKRDVTRCILDFPALLGTCLHCVLW